MRDLSGAAAYGTFVDLPGLPSDAMSSQVADAASVRVAICEGTRGHRGRAMAKDPRTYRYRHGRASVALWCDS